MKCLQGTRPPVAVEASATAIRDEPEPESPPPEAVENPSVDLSHSTFPDADDVIRRKTNRADQKRHLRDDAPTRDLSDSACPDTNDVDRYETNRDDQKRDLRVEARVGGHAWSGIRHSRTLPDQMHPPETGTDRHLLGLIAHIAQNRVPATCGRHTLDE
jgi:hypothetical protein